MTGNTEIFESINIIYEKAKGSKLKPGLLEELDNELGIIAEYIKGSKKEAFIFTAIFANNFAKNRVSNDDLAQFFKCSPIQVLLFNQEIQSLINKNILSQTSRRERNVYSETFIVNMEIAEALAAGVGIDDIAREVFTDPVEMMEELHNIVHDYHFSSEMESQYKKINEFLRAHTEMPLLKKLMNKRLGFDGIFLFLMTIWNVFEGQEDADPAWTMRAFFTKKSDKIRFVKSIRMESHKIIKEDLLRVSSRGFANDFTVTLTETAERFLSDVGVRLTVSKKRGRNIILPDSIPGKRLVYNSKENSQIDLLFRSLQQEKLEVIQKNLKQKGLPEGVVVLLHGPSGTGKTETVYQLAKQTGREIMHVDISQTKSSWFGESEQRIKGLFNAYNALRNKPGLDPILLFNEADGVLSRRSEIENSNVSKTENAMQNILLEELEQFKGVMIATSNMVENIDTAFERRFLFKILMNKPDKNAMAEIWKIKFPMLNEAQTSDLANSFQFSGGQVDNILKKFTLNEIVFGSEPTFDEIKQFCQEETIYDPQAKIGFLNKAG